MALSISKSEKTALVFGATGLVGQHLVEYLLLHPAYKQVHAFSRRPLEVEHPKLKNSVIVFERLEDYAHLIRGNDLFCALGTTRRQAGSKEAFRQVDYRYVLRIALTALKNDVDQLLLVSSVGANPDSVFFYTQVKGELEEAVKKMPFWAIHIFQPSVLMGERPQNRWGEKVAGRIGRFFDNITGGLLTKYRPVEADVVAKAMVKAAQRLEAGIHVYPSHYLQQLAVEEDQKGKLH